MFKVPVKEKAVPLDPDLVLVVKVEHLKNRFWVVKDGTVTHAGDDIRYLQGFMDGQQAKDYEIVNAWDLTGRAGDYAARYDR